MPSPSASTIAKQLSTARKSGQIVVLATGVFDLLHQEHINFLTKAKSAGDILVVGLESDARVKHLKGKGRPVNNQNQRFLNLKKLNLADHLFILPEQFSTTADHEALIATLRPNILAVSSHSPHLDKKRAILAKYSSQVQVVHQHNPAISTTKMLQSPGEI